MDFVRRRSEKTEISGGQFIGWLDITSSKFYDWRDVLIAAATNACLGSVTGMTSTFFFQLIVLRGNWKSRVRS
ncbi:MAG: hypothetical protein LAP39_29665 [Acidobacteriia bacterium]|nr:hypothetical protein [Terriglobia bacterium]